MATETQQETPRRRSRNPSKVEPGRIEQHGGELNWDDEQR
jgi:hypothetical protein